MVARARRRVPWLSVLRNNKWIVLYFLYTLASVLWSENSTTAAIRWGKNFGHLVMVSIIMSETDVPQGDAGFLRPLGLHRNSSLYHRDQVLPACQSVDTTPGAASLPIVGIGLDKNTSAITVCVLALALLWLLLESTRESSARRRVIQHSLLLLSCAWLLLSFRSATAIACGGAGAIALLLLRLPASRAHVRRLNAYAFGAVVLYGVLALTGLG
jgi:hypothetical protein